MKKKFLSICLSLTLIVGLSYNGALVVSAEESDAGAGVPIETGIDAEGEDGTDEGLDGGTEGLEGSTDEVDGGVDELGDGTDELDDSSITGPAAGGVIVKEFPIEDYVITGFEDFGCDSITLEYKPWLKSLTDMMPTNLPAYCGGVAALYEDGSVGIGSSTFHLVSVDEWVCIQDYNQNLGTYDFVPSFTGYEVYETVDLPVITVIILDESEGPVSPTDSDGEYVEIPKLGYYIGNKDIDLYGGVITDKAPVLPTYYNGYDAGKLPAIRNQNPYGSCWSFSAMGALELSLIEAGLAETDINLSEYQILYYSAHTINNPLLINDVRYFEDHTAFPDPHDSYLSGGGAAYMAYRTMELGIGAATEYDETLRYFNNELDPRIGYDYELDDRYMYDLNKYTIQGAYRISLSEPDNVKAAILKYGGVAASYFASTGNYSTGKVVYTASTNCFYGEVPSTNHAIVLVGWDDSFSKDNFPADCRPSSDGAWLVRNSWGYEGYGERGYFWLSYEDKGLLSRKEVTVFDGTDLFYDHTYGFTGGLRTDRWWNFPSGTTVKQYYPVKKGEVIEAIGFEILTANVNCEITVTCGAQEVKQTFKTDYAGYYRVPLDETITVYSDTEVEFSIRYVSDSKDTIKATVEYSSVSSGEVCYLASTDGKPEVNGNKTNGGSDWGDFLMFIYTNDAEKGAALEKTSFSGRRGETAQIRMDGDSKARVTDYTWSSNDTDVATVNSSGLITIGYKKGTALITGTPKNPSEKKLYCEVTVEPYNIIYVLDDDVISYIQPEEMVFYPGDGENCHVPQFVTEEAEAQFASTRQNKYLEVYKSVYKKGYYIAGWSLTPGGEVLFEDDDLVERNGDITLYPVWKLMPFYVHYCTIRADGTYNSYTSVVNGLITIDMLPRNIKDRSMENYVLREFNAKNAETGKVQVGATYYSRDAAGTDVVEDYILTPDDIVLYDASWGQYCYLLSVNIYIQYDAVNIPKMMYSSVIQSDLIGMRTYVDLSTLSSSVMTGLKAVLNGPSGEKVINVADVIPVETEGKSLYYFDYSIPPKDITDEITIKFLDSKGNELTLTNSKFENCGSSYSNTILNVLDTLIEVTTDTDKRNLYASMANHGMISRLGLGYMDVEDYNKWLVSGTREVAAAKRNIFSDVCEMLEVDYSDYSKEIYGSVEGISYIGTSLVLLDKTMIRHYFKLESGYDLSEYNFTVNGMLCTPTEGKGYFYIDIPGIAPGHYTEVYALKIAKDGVNRFSLNYSVASYVYDVNKNLDMSEPLDLLYLVTADLMTFDKYVRLSKKK